MSPDSGDITRLLREWRTGNQDAENELFRLVMPELRRIARYLMQRERRDHSLQATELVDQIYLRLVSAKDRDWQNRRHFFAIAARAMRRHLIDHARGHLPAAFVDWEEISQRMPADSKQMDLVLTIDGLLSELAVAEPEWSQVVEVKYFLGLTDEEAAAALGMKVRTMQRIWRNARRWLFERMEPANARPAT
jgi:RNA polymerase sigma factor (TIGR02999 family)